MTMHDTCNIAVGFDIFKDHSIDVEIEGVTIGADTHDHYTGTYTITPHTYNQVLETDNKVCDGNIVIETIPIDKVSNPMGGLTATIG